MSPALCGGNSLVVVEDGFFMWTPFLILAFFGLGMWSVVAAVCIFFTNITELVLRNLTSFRSRLWFSREGERERRCPHLNLLYSIQNLVGK